MNFPEKCYIMKEKIRFAGGKEKMPPKKQKQFSTRQLMDAPDFEVFHYMDAHPVDVDYHSHDFYEIYFFLSGRVSYVIEGKTYHLRPGDMLLTNNRELHKPLIADGRIYERFVVWISPSFLHSLGDETTDLSRCFDASSRRHYNLLRLTGESLQTIRKLLDRLEAAAERGGFGSGVLRRAYLMELLVAVNLAYFGSVSSEETDIVYNPKVSEILRYINNNLCGDLSLDALSQRFYVSKYHLSRQFKQYVGLTIHQYIMKKRLIAAKLLLLEGSTISEAYIGSGFGDYSNFLKGFKQEFGLSPRKFLELERDDL